MKFFDEKKTTCNWTENNSFWETSCGNKIPDNMTFYTWPQCPWCGKEIKKILEDESKNFSMFPKEWLTSNIKIEKPLPTPISLNKEEERFVIISKILNETISSHLTIPIEWIDEYNSLCKKTNPYYEIDVARLLEKVENNRIQAIKTYRELTGCGLKDAKEKVDEVYYQKFPKNY